MTGRIWRFGRVQFNEAAGTVTIEDETLALDRNCRAILSLLIGEIDESISKDRLLEAGWPGRVVHENSLAKAIGRLRIALGEEGKRIEAVYGSGYRLGGPVVEQPRGADFGGGRSLTSANWPARIRLRLLSPFADRKWSLNLWATLLLCVAPLLFAGAAVVIFSVIQQREAETRASIHMRQAEAVLTFLSTDILTPADPYASGEPDELLRAVVERAAASIDDRFGDDPATRVMLHRAVANAFSGWGEYEKAVMHLDRARGVAKGLYGKTFARESIPIDIALCQNMRLAGDTRQAERVCVRAEETAEQADSPLLAAAHIVRAKLSFEIGQYDEASVSLAAALAQPQGLSAAERADAEWFSGLSLRKLGRFDLADAAYRRNLTMRHTINGDNHPLTAWAYADYGDFLVALGDYPKAERQLSHAQAIFDATLGADHPEALSPAYSLALGHLWRGEAQAARDILQPILARYRETLGADHYWTLYTMTELALAEAQAGRLPIAEALLREARRTGGRVLYGREAKAAHFHMRWARTSAALGNPDEAEAEIRLASLAMDNASYAPDHPWRARLHCLWAQSARVRGDHVRMRQEAQACLSGLNAREEIPASYPSLVEAKALLRQN